MLRTVLVSAVALSLASAAVAVAQDANTGAPAAAGSEAPARAERGPNGVFQRLDADGNGSIGAEEFGGERLEMLRTADTDGDGTLTQQELVTYVMNREFQRRAQRAARMLDIDGDGSVTLAEIEDHQGKRFALIDRNNDGALSQDELRRGGFGKRAMHMGGRGGDGPRFARRGDNHHRGHKFMHRMEPAAPASAADENPAQQ